VIYGFRAVTALGAPLDASIGGTYITSDFPAHGVRSYLRDGYLMRRGSIR
jgi:hypothetical protein